MLITGITGFVGSHMAEYALSRGAEVFGSSRWRSKTENIEHLRSRITLIESDLRDMSSVRALVEAASPSHVVHLAAQSFVGASWQAPAETLSTNIISQVNLLEAIRALKLSPRFLTVGSSEEYGLVYEDELPIRETNPLRPLSPYAVSKVAQDMMGYQYFKSYGLPILRARAFNHSVGRHTPVLLRDDRSGLLDIRYISEIRHYKSAGYLGGQLLEDGTVLWDMRRHAVSVWADGRWSKIIHLSCHPLRPDDRVMRLVTSGGIVEVTGEHSVMVPGPDRHAAVSARELSVGDRVALVGLPQSTGMWVHEDVAWFLGFFVAEGCITVGKVRVDNKDRKPLERCAEVLLRHFGVDSYFVEGERGVWCLTVRRPGRLAAWLHPHVYAGDGNKRVPSSILNAQGDAKLAFLSGYNEGDGLRAGHGSYEFKSFKTKSPILTLGLCYLITNTTRQRICLNTEVRPTGTYYLVNLNSSNEAHERWGRHLEIPEDVIKKVEAVSYVGEVWDFETEDHVFHAGLGRNLVHNTGPRRGDVFVESNFARQVAEIEAGLTAPAVRVGDLKPRRDYSDVRDIVRGYWLLLERGEPGEVYNLCSGRTWSIQQVLDFLLAQSTVKGITVKVDAVRLRPSDVMVLEGDPSKIAKATGWKAEVPFERTLTELLDYWRQRVRRASG
ncbi:MAG TPA: GDP-mannose 4,6-dehydratase [Methylomirabilota bacterium]|jgi:GDP-4-dehydro-6-deoxy-D-mannose reductase|nr:GDP-mannose 4,6-dehydratase [Methylomirabilota bacterium]